MWLYGLKQSDFCGEHVSLHSQQFLILVTVKISDIVYVFEFMLSRLQSCDRYSYHHFDKLFQHQPVIFYNRNTHIETYDRMRNFYSFFLKWY